MISHAVLTVSFCMWWVVKMWPKEWLEEDEY